MPNELRLFVSNTAQTSQIRHESNWLWAASLMVVLSAHLSVVIVGLLMTPADAGAYFAAFKISQLLHLPMVAAGVVAVPSIAPLIERGDKSELQDYCRVMAIILAVTSAFGAAAIFSAPQWFLSLLEEEYRIASNALVLLALGFLVSAFCGLSIPLMIAVNGERSFFIYQCMFDGGATVLIFPLVYVWGLEGTSLAILLGKIGWNAAAVVWCRPHLRVDPAVFAVFQTGKTLANRKPLKD